MNVHGYECEQNIKRREERLKDNGRNAKQYKNYVVRTENYFFLHTKHWNHPKK